MKNRLVQNFVEHLDFYYFRALDDNSKLEDFKNELLECRKIINAMRKHDFISGYIYKVLDETLKDYAMRWFKLECKNI